MSIVNLFFFIFRLILWRILKFLYFFMRFLSWMCGNVFFWSGIF